MISARNYAAQAEAALYDYASMLESARPWEDAEHDAFVARLLAKQIKTSVHFALPDDGVIFNDNLKGLEGVQIRLPYKSITVEYFVNEDKAYLTPEDGSIHSPKRLVLAQELSKEEMKQSNIYHKMLYKYYETFQAETLIMICVVNVIDGFWVLCPVGQIIPSNWEDQKDYERYPMVNPSTYRKSAKRYQAGYFVPFSGFANHVIKTDGQMALTGMIKDTLGEMTALLELCEALTCTNVITEVLQPENKKANKKRICKGKLPIYETKILSIEVPKTNYKTGAPGADRNSPRQHLRRGHIRHLQDKKIWVNSCVVGNINAGKIDKSYHISAAS